MKFNRYILILISILSIINLNSFNSKSLKSKLNKSNNNSNSSNPSLYKVVLLGNTGEMKLWKKEADDVKKTNLSIEKKTNKIFSFGKTVVNGAKCLYTEKGKTEIDFTTDEAAKNYGTANYNDVINSATFKVLAQEANNIIFLGNVVYVEAEGLQINKGGKVAMHRPDLWKNRLNCAWNMFVSQLVKVKLHSGAFLADKVDILPGEKSYEVNYEAEKEFNFNFMQKQKQNGIYYMMKDGTLKTVPKTQKQSLYTNVRKYTVKVGERKINFVDFNSSVLLCMNKDGKTYYDKCPHHKNYQLEKWGFTKALEYYTTLVHVLKSLEDHAWNVIRAHHPPTNFRDGDTDFYWAKLQDNRSLIDLFKMKKVRMFFASHLNSHAVMILPYKDVNLREKGDKAQITEQGAFCNLENMKFETSVNSLLTNKQCYKNTAFVINTLKEDVMLVFITGAGGRSFDTLNNGTLSTHGSIIWARNMKLNDGRNAFGFVNVMIRIEDVQVEYYEIFDTKEQIYESKKTAEFKITEYKKGPGEEFR